MSEKVNIEDPCAEFGPTQKWAVVWFLSVLVITALLVCKLSEIDRKMYDTNAECLDYDQYRANRASSFGLKSEAVDPRQRGSYSEAVSLSE